MKSTVRYLLRYKKKIKKTNEDFALKRAAKTDLMKGISHIELSNLVYLTDSVPKHNGPKHNFRDLLC